MSADAATAMVEIGMPRLSDSMEEATVLEWLKQPGDVVRKGEPLVEVETDKATIVYEAELDGVLEEIVVDEGETAALGAVIARCVSRARCPAPRRPQPARPPRPPARPSLRRPGPRPPPATPAPAAAVDTCRCATARHPSRAGLRRSSVSRSRARRHGAGRPDRPRRRPGWPPATARSLGARQPGRARGRGGDRAHVDPAHDRAADVASPGPRSRSSRSRRRSTWSPRHGCATICASRAASRSRRSTISSCGLPRSRSGSSRA